ncbi:MAG: mechanosensitive ion channel [Rubrobacter sp.]|nr:mechanosensitive ion channel [Rubrobacter sp.]
MNELIEAFVVYLPRIVGALALGVLGLVLAVLIRRVTPFVLRRLQFDRLCERAGITSLMREGSIHHTPTQFASVVVFYAILALVFVAALASLGLDVLAGTLNQLILYAPRALVAILTLIFGAAAAGLLAQLTGRVLSEVGVSRTSGLKGFIRFGIIFIAAILAAAVLGIDVTILIVITIIGFGAAALAAALALGLGLRELSENVAAGRYLSEGISEGDEISLNGISGTVEHIGHAMTTVRGPNGRVYLVPNAHFLEHVVEKQEPSTPEAYEDS